MTKRVAIYARVSTDKTQTTETQLRQLRDVATRLGWQVVAEHVDEGISGAHGRDKRPGLDSMMRQVTRGEIDMVAAWSVDRLGRSIQHLVGLYLHIQGLDTSTPSGRAMFQMLGVFAELEKSLIAERVRAGIERARAKGTRFGRPAMDTKQVTAIRAAISQGMGIRAAARATGCSPTTASKIAKQMAAKAQAVST